MKVVLAGAFGHLGSDILRELVRQRAGKRMPDLRIYFGLPEYSGDNAVGAALIGAGMLKAQRGKRA